MEASWKKFLEIIKDQIDTHNFKIWFGKIALGEITENKVVIKVPSAFIKEQLIRRYERVVLDALQKAAGKDLEVEYKIDSSLAEKKTAFVETEEPFDFSPSLPSHIPTSNLNPKYTLESFVVGLTNNLAYAAAQAVVQNPGISYNPLFIYGASGVGKTHLMQGIGHALLKKNPGAKLIFVSSERFMNGHVQSIQTKKTFEFRNRYRSADILLIDDIQFIAGKDSTQEEFFHTYNELHAKNTQIVLTSDRPPREMEKLEDRLASRFQGGLMVDIQMPDFDTRMAILKTKLTERGESLPLDCLNLLAENVVSNARELEGKLIQVLQTIKLQPTTDPFSLVQSIIGKQVSLSTNKLSQKQVLEVIHTYFNINIKDILGPRRQKELVLPRQLAMYILYQDCGIPMEKIGQILGGRDHTTVLHGIEKIKGQLTRDREVERLVIELRQQLRT